MTLDLWMLLGTALLCLGMPLVYGAGRFRQPGGIAWSAGNRDTPLPVPPWVQRGVRAHANLVENLLPFAVIVLVVHVAGKANAASAIGATVFFVGRVAYLAAYLAGLNPLRSIIWFGAWVGGLMVLAQAFR